MTARPGPPLYPFPEELLAIPRDASAVIEASAGTGKTYLLEHLVIDRVITGAARLEEILIVTFTEKATGELVRRLRALLARLLGRPEPPPSGTPAERCWRLDAAARQRLTEAQHAFDRATIATIHGFCQRVLTENAFASGRLLAQEHVDSGKAFADAFKEALQLELAVHPRSASYLEACLIAGSDLDKLEKALHDAHIQRRPWGIVYDEARLRAAVEAYAAVEVDARLLGQVQHLTDGRTVRALGDRAQRLSAICRGFRDHGDPATVLREIDEAIRWHDNLFSYFALKFPAAPPGPLADLRAAFLAVGEAAPPLELAAAQIFQGAVEARLRARKEAAGLYDFDDMLHLVAEALRGPSGPPLVASLRQRYRLAIIDEFQDTDTVQWEIFRRLFADSGGTNPLVVIGDPKQSIYGFRGADLPTYQEARRAICGDSDVPTVTLRRNFRSTQAVIDTCNAIFDPGGDPAFFADPTLNREPAICARPDQPATSDDPPVVLLAVQPANADFTHLPLPQVRQALTQAIALEIEALRGRPSPPPLREIFVLTRARSEADQVARALRERGIPHVLYNQEGLYATAEAIHVRDLLAAIDNPRDPALRLRAWLTPFFGLGLADLPACAALPGGHPLEERLFAWRAVAEARDWARLWDRILDESGVVERELMVGGSARRLTNYQQLFDVVLAQTAGAPVSLGDLIRRLSALATRGLIPNPEEGNVQRSEGERDAVQVMTSHKAKGLEADHVFLYGAFSLHRGARVRAYSRGAERVLFAGKARWSDLEEALRVEAEAEDQRLFYVALTRARRRLYLPYAGNSKIEDEAPGEEKIYWRVNGGYRHVHRRLRALVNGGSFGVPDERFRAEVRPVVCPPPPDDTPARIAARLAAAAPDPRALALTLPSADLAELRRRRAGITLTSYTRLKEAAGGYHPPTEVLDEADAATEAEALAGAETADEARAPGLPGGTASGIFLHALLEAVPLDTLAGAAPPPVEEWAARPEIEALVSTAMRRHDRDPRHRADAERLVHAALTTPLPLGAGGLTGVASAARVAREVEFLFPFPAAAGGADRGFVKGYIDFVLEHEGRTYFGDWKSDLLPDWSPAGVGARVAGSYELQRRLYTLALLRMLGIDGRADYEARFGGTIYVFVRGLPAGIEARRPTWEEAARWEEDLAGTLAGGER